MTSRSGPRLRRQAHIVKGARFICVLTFSGYATRTMVPKRLELYMEPSASDIDLGDPVLIALSLSRFVLPEEAMELFDYRQVGPRVDAWMEGIARRFGYSSARAAFKGVDRVAVDAFEDEVDVVPFRQRRFDAWEGLPDEYTVKLSVGPKPREMGQAVK